MKSETKQRPMLPLMLLMACLFFLGINGVVGGYLMLSNPNGIVMGMPLSYLDKTPFTNWFIPGLWLMFIWGCGSFVIMLGLWFRPQWAMFDLLTFWTHEHWAWALSILLGLALIVWLTVQVFTLPELAVIQFILYGLAALLMGLPFVPSMRAYYQFDKGGEAWSHQ